MKINGKTVITLAAFGLALFNFIDPHHVAFADTNTPGGNAPSTSIPGLSSDGTLTSTTDVGTWIKTKGMAIMAIVFTIATIVLVGIGATKGTKLSSSNSRNRAEAISDMIWWIVGAAVTFAAAIITGMIFLFAKAPV